MAEQHHWQEVYRTKANTAVSWYQPQARRSLAMITSLGLAPDAPVIDVGGGASTLVDDLLAGGHRDVTVLDLADSALEVVRSRLGTRAAAVQWMAADIRQAVLPAARYVLWHDRAVFHFLTAAEDRVAYRRQLAAALRPDGYLLIATFAEDGPERCSGLPVRRYSIADLQAEFAPDFSLRVQAREQHHTPSGGTQSFIYALFARRVD